ncbi:hypothetical protein C8Q76DRAFT_694566 [Earliella scabrosa]|nr:hypothetical protein C8Q76DRAFT_694566 [Earliella scabrosa]
MRTKKRLYLGEVLDIYKKIARRHGSIPKATSCAGLPYFSLRAYLPLSVPHENNENELADEDDPAATMPFSCRVGNSRDLHTHASAGDFLYNLGCNATTSPPEAMMLKEFAASRWQVLAKPEVQEVLAKTGKRKTTRGKSKK